MKNTLIYITSFLISTLTFYSCTNDDDATVNNNEDILDQTTILDAITTNSSDGIWGIQQGTLLKQDNSEIELTGYYSVEDDLFTFTQGTSESLNLRWKKGFDINMQAQNLQEALTDRNASSETFVLSLNQENGDFSSTDNRVVGNYDEGSDTILITITDPESDTSLRLNITPKNTADFAQIPTTMSNAQELFSFHTQVRLNALEIAQSQNNLYLANSTKIQDFDEQSVFKYDLSTNELTTLSFIEPDFTTKNIEFIDGQLFNIGGTKFQAIDYELTTINTTFNIDPSNPLILIGAASLDDAVYTFGDLDRGNEINIWNIGDQNAELIATTPEPIDRIYSDGEIVDQVLYIFGGYNSPVNDGSTGSNIVYTYNIDTGVQNQIQLPVGFQQTATSTVENLIYVMGAEPFGSNHSENTFFGAYNTLDGTFQEITLNIADQLEDRILDQIQVVGDKAYFVTTEISGGDNGLLNKVFVADLN